MKLLKILLLVLVAFGVYHHFSKDPVSEEAEYDPDAPSLYGFVELPAIGKASQKGIVVMAALNCPEAAAQRANALTAQLEQRGLPVTRSNGVNFRVTNGDNAMMQRINSVMRAELPIVFVNGRAKSNPSYREVLAEYGVGE